ncbi:hypothetical protein SAMN05444506_11476 [Pseudomonas syringae]|nr:hypothetical protein SAMN05444506_11476 [Pseudomonas syringae]
MIINSPSLTEVFPRAIFRSLLQKLVRRGHTDLIESVAFALAEHGDSKWVQKRTGVILLEECWPFARSTKCNTPSILTLKKIASSKKNKDASGLGSLAYEYSNGNRRAATDSPDTLSVKIVAAGLQRPEDFFYWLENRTLSLEQKAIIDYSKLLLKMASWQWDKAFCIAASYLAISSVSETAPFSPVSESEFPIWVAIDKHTPEGRAAIQRASMKLKVPFNQLSWISFYLESARVNYLVESPWWTAERKWRFGHLNMTESYAEEVWSAASKIIKEDLLPHVINAEGFIKINL